MCGLFEGRFRNLEWKMAVDFENQSRNGNFVTDFAMKEERLLIPAKKALTDFLKSRGMRCTPERFAILEKVFSSADHFYADALYEALEMEGYHVSLSTVYATMQLLVDAGLVRRHQFPNQPAQYERVAVGTKANHHHLVCTCCGRVREVKDAALMEALGARRYKGFTPEHVALYVYGLCSRCRKLIEE